jgi:hypothetical protein
VIIEDPDFFLAGLGVYPALAPGVVSSQSDSFAGFRVQIGFQSAEDLKIDFPFRHAQMLERFPLKDAAAAFVVVAERWSVK